jgi:hypothetical protein
VVVSWVGGEAVVAPTATTMSNTRVQPNGERKDRPSLSPNSALDVTRRVFRRGSKEAQAAAAEIAASGQTRGLLPFPHINGEPVLSTVSGAPIPHSLPQQPAFIPVSTKRIEMDIAEQELEMTMAFYDGSTATLRDRINSRESAFAPPRGGTAWASMPHMTSTRQRLEVPIVAHDMEPAPTASTKASAAAAEDTAVAAAHSSTRQRRSNSEPPSPPYVEAGASAGENVDAEFGVFEMDDLTHEAGKSSLGQLSNRASLKTPPAPVP